MATCSIGGCGSNVLARGWCSKHYDRWRKHGDPTKGGRPTPKECKEDGCGRRAVGQGWCDTHHARFVRMPRRAEKRKQALADRQCAHCGEPVPTTRNARASYCSRDCKVAAHAASGKGRESLLRSYYKRRYGLTLETVESMRRAGCGICGRINGGGRHGQLHIDHCHATGRVRGALCDSCNTGLGKFRDDPRLLKAAVHYLTQPPIDYTP